MEGKDEGEDSHTGRMEGKDGGEGGRKRQRVYSARLCPGDLECSLRSSVQHGGSLTILCLAF